MRQKFCVVETMATMLPEKRISRLKRSRGLLHVFSLYLPFLTGKYINEPKLLLPTRMFLLSASKTQMLSSKNILPTQQKLLYRLSQGTNRN